MTQIPALLYTNHYLTLFKSQTFQLVLNVKPRKMLYFLTLCHEIESFFYITLFAAAASSKLLLVSWSFWSCWFNKYLMFSHQNSHCGLVYLRPHLFSFKFNCMYHIFKWTLSFFTTELLKHWNCTVVWTHRCPLNVHITLHCIDFALRFTVFALCPGGL